MKFNGFIVSAALICLLSSCDRTPEVAPAIPRDPYVEAKVEKVLRKMTLEEKIGQMTQIAITAIANGTELTAAGDSILRTYKVGSVLNTPGDVAQTPESYDRLVAQINRIAIEETGIPTLYGPYTLYTLTNGIGNKLSQKKSATSNT